MSICDSLFTYIDSQRDELLSLLERMVSIPSCGREPEDANSFAIKLKEIMEAEGFSCELIDTTNPKGGRSLVGIWGESFPRKPIVFSGHLDTALYRCMMEENPFRTEGDKAWGVGVLDMKGGIVVALAVARALRKIGFSDRPIKMIWSGDEEVNHRDSNGGEIMSAQAKGALCAFNMETGLLSNALCIGRKGGTRCRIKVEGVEAHAGNDFTRGRSAIEEMAHKILDICALTDLETGTTMNVGTIQGGTIFNAVPKECEIIVDMRFESNSELDIARKRLEEVCAKTYIEGTITTMEYIDIMHVFETTEPGMRFFEHVKETARRHGLPPVSAKSLGGSSDAAYTTMAGVPTLCSCGTMGEWNHTTREYILTDSLTQRAKLISAAIIDIEGILPV